MNAKEDSNFRLFSYVGEINSEAEKLQAHEDDVQRELDRYQAAADAQDSERQAKLQVTCEFPSPSLSSKIRHPDNFITEAATLEQGTFQVPLCCCHFQRRGSSFRFDQTAPLGSEMVTQSARNML